MFARSNQRYFDTLLKNSFAVLRLDTPGEHLVQPTITWTKKDGRPRRLAATDLRKDEHFVFRQLPEDVLQRFLENLKTPLGSEPLILTPPEKGNGDGIQVELHRIAVEILMSTATLRPRTEQGEDMSEAEVRFGVVDALVKGIARCTDTVLTAEVSVCSSDNMGTSFQAVSSIETPTQQKNLSASIVPDYTLYTLSNTQGAYVCGVVEVKTAKNFNNTAVCQTIGYHVARKAGIRTVVPADPEGSPGRSTEETAVATPLAILFCHNKVRFLFFPFSCENSSCIDAIVTPTIDIFQPSSISEDWFSFVCYYITSHFHPIRSEDLMGVIAVHPMKEFSQFMEEEPTVQDLQIQLAANKSALAAKDEELKKLRQALAKLKEETTTMSVI